MAIFYNKIDSLFINTDPYELSIPPNFSCVPLKTVLKKCPIWSMYVLIIPMKSRYTILTPQPLRNTLIPTLYFCQTKTLKVDLNFMCSFSFINLAE